MSEATAIEIYDQKIYRQWGLLDEEYNLILKLIGRKPNYTETGLFSVMWSEHCSYKNSKSLLKKFPNSGENILQGPGEGAGIIDIGDDKAVVFKAESHNHPSAVEPYEGAATGVGGIIRDIFSMGATPIANLNSLRFGEIKDSKTQYLISEVVSGIGGYGNCIGIPTVGGDINFDKTYQSNPLVNAMCVGVMDISKIQQGRATGVSNEIVYVGAKTGRDGIHGATFASDEFADDKETQRSAVQVGDPFMEKLLMDACIELINEHSDWIVGIQDMGAAGLVSSTAEMAAKSNTGLILDLSKVPQSELAMTPYEIMLSESQERMAICVKKDNVKEVIELFKKYDLDAVSIGEVTENRDYVLIHNDKKVADIPVKALIDDVPTVTREQKMPKRIEEFKNQSQYIPEVKDLKTTIKEVLKQPTIASKQSLYKTYDSQVKTNTIVKPGSDAAVVHVPNTNKALSMTTDCNSRYIYLDPKIGGEIAVAEAARNIVASGAKPLGITDCLNYGNPEKPEIYWEFAQSVEGIAQACREFNTPVISGNVSLYNESNDQAIYPSPMIGMVGLIDDLKKVTTQSFKKDCDLIYLIGETKDDYSGSEIQKLLTGDISGALNFDMQSEINNQNLVSKLIDNNLIASAHDLSEGGLITGLLEAAFDNNLGFNVELDMTDAQLFSESQSRFIVTVSSDNKEEFEKMANDKTYLIGKVIDNKKVNIKTKDSEVQFSIDEVKDDWVGAIPCLMK
ncbi:phosphoribosylformylglycinamidine synthase subunit PurL [Companilactobacillus sp. RD055328]|uniref:phosphoribosylformylglycinamidine synthase subunit PurL n=1 Tax=Companilactobacillus sp. RD055328 TaxID=2916634 RepID=UPI001FC84A9A|nr:phosphoribosylformylglycinamidine synthase subunit PurL [Companilactobacillus sp. RD055328]GKQ42593.1 phosphoribosylformylglycinamidine synthase subunit PurL [Companilactobacillus sp. RD055328]